MRQFLLVIISTEHYGHCDDVKHRAEKYIMEN